MSWRPPVSLTSLVGRDRDLQELGQLVTGRRLVTLTGAGGSGKTRLAAEIGLRMDWERTDSAAWVELWPCDEAPAVPAQVAATLGLRTATAEGPLGALTDSLRDRDLVLILDGCEHVIGAAAELAQRLLVECPSLRILATSREPLGVPGEHVWPVPPVAPADALQLFTDRASAVDPAFCISEENRGAVAEVCRRLDGLPLAIELAAARVRVLTPQQILSKLCDRFTILTGGSRGAVPRHRTLRAAIDWSFALLSPEEQALLARLSVFAGTFPLEAAETVCGADLDLLGGLVDKSLLTTARRSGTVRYGLLETIREYARERLAASGESDALRRAHALHYLEMARQIVVDPMGDITERLQALDFEHDNVRAALSWSLEHEPDAIALPLAAAFRWYWYYRILWSEGFDWLSRVLARTAAAASRDRAAALAGAGTFAGYVGNLDDARRWLEEAERMWREIGDGRELALTLAQLAQMHANARELEAAQARATETMELVRSHGTAWDIGYCLTNAAAFVAERRGDFEEADRVLAAAEAIWVPCRHPLGLPFVHGLRARLAMRMERHDVAASFARAALREARMSRELWFCARSLRVLALTSIADPLRAARLLGASELMLRTIGARMLVHERVDYERLASSLRESLGAETFEAAMREASAASFDDICDFALAEDEAAASDSPLLHVGDLGALEIALGGKPIASDGRGSNRARELLVFLLAHPPGPTKDEVGVAFWPDATADQVKNSFHVTLHRLRKLLGGADTVTLDGARYVVSIPHTSESGQFDKAMHEALRSGDVDSLQRALSLYRGEFLQGEDAGEWSLPIRSRLRQLHLRGLFALGRAYETRGQYADASDVYTRILAREALHEAAARQLMICRARMGARTESLLVYRNLEQRLREDLQAAPEPETATLYQRLRQNENV